MSTLHEAAQQALEALEWADNAMYEGEPIQVNTQKAITALRAALAEPVQEPVAWKLWDEDPQGGGDWRYYDAKDFKNGINPTEYFDGLVPLYAAPPQRKPLTEEEIKACEKQAMVNGALLAVVNKLEYSSDGCIKRYPEESEVSAAIERAHGIT